MHSRRFKSNSASSSDAVLLFHHVAESKLSPQVLDPDVESVESTMYVKATNDF